MEAGDYGIFEAIRPVQLVKFEENHLPNNKKYPVQLIDFHTRFFGYIFVFFLILFPDLVFESTK